MFKLTLRLFLLTFAARSAVASLECYQTNEAACGSKTDKKDLAKCLSGKYEKFKCESPRDKACIRGHIIDKDGTRIDLRGCTSNKAAPKDICEKELFDPIAGNGFPHSSRKEEKCVACQKDNCNVASYKNVSYVIFFACLVTAVVLFF